MLDGLTYRPLQDYSLDHLLVPVSSPAKKGEDKERSKYASRAATTLATNELLDSGVEIFKQGSEQISDFAFDCTSYTDNIALGLMISGIREIPMVNTLLFRNRYKQGLQLIDEENLKWEECLHRYDEYDQIEYGSSSPNAFDRQPEILPSKNEPMTALIDGLMAHKTISFRSKPLRRKGVELLDTELEPAKVWNGSPSEAYMTHTSKLDITHEDYTFPVESHPHLPIFMSGNRRGIICSWKFGQSKDQSLNQLMPEADPRYADPKKACVKKMMFNTYGDKLMSNNMEGSFFVYQIDCMSKHMRKVPLFSLYENVDTKVSDFDLLNSDNIICTISQKQKTVKVYDLLLPYSFGKQAQVMEFKLAQSVSCGNLILANQRR